MELSPIEEEYENSNMQDPFLLLTFLLNFHHKTGRVAHFQGDLLYLKSTNQSKAKLVYYLHWHSPQVNSYFFTW